MCFGIFYIHEVHNTQELFASKCHIIMCSSYLCDGYAKALSSGMELNGVAESFIDDFIVIPLFKVFTTICGSKKFHFGLSSNLKVFLFLEYFGYFPTVF